MKSKVAKRIQNLLQKIDESKFYDIDSAYGKVGNKNLGMGLLPSSIEILYNKNKLNNQSNNLIDDN